MRTASILFVAIAAITATPALAQNGAGTTAATVLTLPAAPRPLAFGGAYAAVADDQLAVFYSPARLAVAPPSAGIAYQSLPLGAGAGSLGAALRAGPGTIGAGIQFLDYGEIDVVETDPGGGDHGIPAGERVSGGELALGLGYAVGIGRHLQVGAVARVLRIQLAEATASGTAWDLGASLALAAERVVVALALQNLGNDIGPARAAPLPRQLRIGTAIRLGNDFGPRTTLALDAFDRHGELRVAAGIEAGFAAPAGLEMVGRIGYRQEGHEETGPPFVFGAGIILKRIAVDYAYRAQGPLGVTHLFGISVHAQR